MMDLQGQFLIAMPQLEDYFQNTVVYMCEHNEQGSMGLVINAPEKYLVALGCASWTAGQLEQEIADNAWLVAPASDTILFETIYEDRYLAANQLLGINPHNFVFSQVGHS